MSCKVHSVELLLQLIRGSFPILKILNTLQLVVAPLLSIIHVYSVCEEMRATPVNTLNPQRTAMIVAEFVKVHI